MVLSYGRRNYRRTDLREKLGRRHSPPRRNSLDKEARHPFPSYGHSSPRLGKKSDWGHRRRQQFDGENDYAGSLRSVDGVGRQASERKPSLSESTDVNDEQLKQMHSKIDMLEDQKQQLQIYLEESIEKADGLNSKIEEIEMQLSAEKDECKRISSKIMEFVKANIRHGRIQDELKRSQAHLQRLGDQLGSDALVVANEEDISIDVSDEETLDNLLMIPQNDKASPRKDETSGNPIMDPRKDQYKVYSGKRRTRVRMVEADESRKDETLGNPIMGRRKDLYEASPSKKRMRDHMVEADEKSKQANSAARKRRSLGHMRSERQNRWEPNVAQTINTDKVGEEANGINSDGPLVNNIKPKQRKTNFTSASSGDKLNDIKSTRMVAHMMDEVVDVVELNEKPDSGEVSSARVKDDLTLDNIVLPPPPPLPVAEDAYLQYKGKDEFVDVVTDYGGDTDDYDDDDLNEADDDEMLDVDIV
uniref:zinc finger CCCH domain-containing protein 13 isoform X2 n=1 Tax=Erigeron canadensis TaxID=72917 RepID=UPI001CB95CE5|nr:zinc finger CCCH domain-containing protein 13 isoform X2 [Erigeron canadensis]